VPRLAVAALAIFTFFAGAGQALARECLDPPTIVGTPGNDRLVGTPGRDVIHALEGSDVVRALEGRDVICGGDGPDYIYGGPRS
jgi:Ca2+-binding RTX toxin-like protein